jgi:hypothetical protein
VKQNIKDIQNNNENCRLCMFFGALLLVINQKRILTCWLPLWLFIFFVLGQIMRHMSFLHYFELSPMLMCVTVWKSRSKHIWLKIYMLPRDIWHENISKYYKANTSALLHDSGADILKHILINLSACHALYAMQLLPPTVLPDDNSCMCFHLTNGT